MDASLSVFLLLPAFCSSDADFLLFFGALPFSDIERLPETFFRSGRTLTPSDSVREVRRASEDSFFPFSIFCSDVRSAFFVFWLFVCSFCSCGVVPFVLRFSVSDLVTAFFIFLSRYSRCRLFGSSFLHSGFYIPALHAFLFCALLIP